MTWCLGLDLIMTSGANLHDWSKPPLLEQICMLEYFHTLEQTPLWSKLYVNKLARRSIFARRQG